MVLRAPFVAMLLSLAVSAPAGIASAQSLDPADRGDNAILRAHRCGKTLRDEQYSAAATERCRRVYDLLSAELGDGAAMGAADRNKYAIGRFLALAAVTSGYLKQDGRYTHRACLLIPRMEEIAAGYRPGLTPDWDAFNGDHRQTVREVDGKCL